MTSRWPRVKLCDATEIYNGGTPKTSNSDYWDGGIPWVTPAEMGKLSSPYIDKTRRSLTNDGLKSSNTKLMPPYSVIMSSRAPIGHLVINTIPMTFNQGCKGIVPKKMLEHKFLYYFLLAQKDFLNSLGSGTTFLELSSGKLKDVEIPLPPLDEQKRIVAKLDKALVALDQVTENSKIELEQINILWTAFLESALDPESAVSKSTTKLKWPDIRLGDLINLEYGKGLDPSSRKHDGKYPVYGAAGVKAYSNEHLVEGDSIVIGRKGSAGELTRVNGKFWPLDVTYYVALKSINIDIDYLFNWLGSKNLAAMARGVKPGINRNEVYELFVPLPPLDEQKRIVTRLNSLKLQIEELRKTKKEKLEAVASLRSSILNAAFAGEL